MNESDFYVKRPIYVDFVIRNGGEADIMPEDLDNPRVMFFTDTKEFVVSRGDGTYENITREITSVTSEANNARLDYNKLEQRILNSFITEKQLYQLFYDEGIEIPYDPDGREPIEGSMNLLDITSFTKAIHAFVGMINGLVPVEGEVGEVLVKEEVGSGWHKLPVFTATSNGLVPAPDSLDPENILFGNCEWRHVDVDRSVTVDAQPVEEQNFDLLMGENQWGNTFYGEEGEEYLGLPKPDDTGFFGHVIRVGDGGTGQIVYYDDGTVYYRTAREDAQFGAWHKLYPADNADQADKLKIADTGSTDTAVYFKDGIPIPIDKVKASAVADKWSTSRTFGIKSGKLDEVTVPIDGGSDVHIVLTGIDADTISGIIPISNLPQGALERLIDVDDEAGRFALTTEQVQTGDIVRQDDNGVMYVVVDDAHLDSEAGYREFSAGIATRATEADHAAKADLANNATEAEHAKNADLAKNATEATHAESASNADNATEAEHAERASNADLADKATNADHALLADSATSATSAVSSASATNAAHADEADHADSASNADNATEAEHAKKADNAVHAESADSAESATNATNAVKAQSADSATNASEAAHAKKADDATHADSADSADSATNATNASEADHAKKADEATHAGSADSATSASSATNATNAVKAQSADSATKATESVYSKYLQYRVIGDGLDLNTLKGTEGAGVYYKSSTNTTLINVPANIAPEMEAILEVIPLSGEGITEQRYTTMGLQDAVHLYVRHTDADGNWEGWVTIGPQASIGEASHAENADNAHMANVAKQLGSVDVGSATRPIFLSEGNPTAISGSVGDATTPISLINGVFTKIDKVKAAATADTATSAGSATTADSATEAEHAKNADSATSAGHATSADSATEADHAATADSATDATKLPLAGGTLTGNLYGQYLVGTWLQTKSAGNLTSAPTKYAVIDPEGWIYYRTLEQTKTDLGVGSLQGSDLSDDDFITNMYSA